MQAKSKALETNERSLARTSLIAEPFSGSMVTSLHYARATRLHKLGLDALLRSAAVEAIRATPTKECRKAREELEDQSKSVSNAVRSRPDAG
jgi:hypothetical protein